MGKEASSMHLASAILSGSRSRISMNSSARMRWTSFAGIGWKQLARRNGDRGAAEVKNRATSSECRAAGEWAVWWCRCSVGMKQGIPEVPW